MKITIYKLQESNTKKAVKVARKSFGIIGPLIIRKPKQGFVALIDDNVVGGVFYDIKKTDTKKIGVVSFLFTNPQFGGHGIAGKLLATCIDSLWADGCDGVVSYVQDDNVGSWVAFEKCGFVKTTLLKSSKALGTATALKAQILFVETFVFCVGADFYMALPDREETKKYLRKDTSVVQIGLFVLVNLIFLSLAVLRSPDFIMAILSIVLFFAGMSVAGLIGTWLTGRKWQFRFTQGGFVLSPILGLFGFYPMIGNWYPVKYEKTPHFRRDMAFNSILSWFFLFGLMISARFIDNLALEGMANLAKIFLVFRCVPIDPFSSYGSGRVYKWNKIIFVLFAIVSLLFVFVL
jgi:GNAT superfamily N-acetyltransferase